MPMPGFLHLFSDFLSHAGEPPAGAFSYVSAEFDRRYALWRAAQPPWQTPTEAETPYRPLLSIVGEAGVGQAALQAQTYSHWELVSNPAEARGAYFLYLHAGDTLVPDALMCFIAALNTPHRPDLLYADEDVVQKGVHRQPRFKAALFTVNLLAGNCLGRPLLVSRALLEAAGPPADFSAGEEYAFALRAAFRCAKSVHVAQVLLSRDSHAEDPPAERAALDAFLQARHIPGYAVQGKRPGAYRIRLRERDCPRIAVILPNRNGAAALRRLLESLERNALYPHYSLFILDYGTEDLETLRYYDLLRANRAATVIFTGEQAPCFAKLWNRGARAARCPLLLFMKPETEILSPDFLLALAELALREGAGAVSASLVSDGRPMPASPLLHAALYENLPFLQSDIHAATLLRGDCMMLRSEIFFEAGGFDETFTRVGADMELSLRLMRRGRIGAVTPYAACRACELELAASDKDRMRLKDALYPLKAGDPALSGRYREVWQAT